jgi:membrane protease YdiL (CAAX protease family)
MQFLRNLFLSPDEARLRAGWRILAHLLLLFLLGSLLTIPMLALASLSPIFAFIGDGFLIGLIGITLSVYVARRWLDKRSFSSLGLRWDPDASRDLLVGILIPALLMALIFLTEWAFGWLDFQGISGRVGPSQTLEIGYWAAAFLMVGYYEELLSRGYWLQNIAEGLGLPVGVFLSSAIFAILHAANPSASVMSTLGILAAGYFLAFGYLRTRQLWLPIGLHIGWNFFQGPIFGFHVSGLETARLLIHTSVGPDQGP